MMSVRLSVILHEIFIFLKFEYFCVELQKNNNNNLLMLFITCNDKRKKEMV